jgi:hypothetical protein
MAEINNILLWVTTHCTYPLYFYFLIIGGVLMILELVISEFFLLWIGLATLLTGITTFTFNVGLTETALIFSGYAAICLFLGFKVYNKQSDKTVTSGLNSRAEQLVGTLTILRMEDENAPYVMIDGTRWPVCRLQALQDGAKVRVIEVRGNVLLVE